MGLFDLVPSFYLDLFDLDKDLDLFGPAPFLTSRTSKSNLALGNAECNSYIVFNAGQV